MWAIRELEKLGVTLQPEDVTRLARLSPQTTLEECLGMGATKQTHRLTVLPAEEDIAVFTDITIEHEGHATHPACRWREWDEGTLWVTDEAHMLLIASEPNVVTNTSEAA